MKEKTFWIGRDRYGFMGNHVIFCSQKPIESIGNFKHWVGPGRSIEWEVQSDEFKKVTGISLKNGEVKIFKLIEVK